MTIETLLTHLRQLTPKSGNGYEIPLTTLQLAQLHDLPTALTQSVLEQLVSYGSITRPDERDKYMLFIPVGATIPKTYNELISLPPQPPTPKPDIPYKAPTIMTSKPGIRLSEI